ncbi:MAG: PKD domain-containing protein [Flavobacteriales bacterium]|nr:PKD domain-containing protein [Flavobacteriales bacterium]MCB9447225.1 PKD domain-containing protein [Flavobacteriales bacterium]
MAVHGPGQDCNNPDFEMCDFSGWETYVGEVNTSPYVMINSVSTDIWCSEKTGQCTNLPPPDPACGCDQGGGVITCGNGCTGTSTTNGVCTCTSCPCAFNSSHFIVSSGTDEVTKAFPKVYPGGGGCSALIGDKTGTGGKAASVAQTFRVSKANANFVYHWAAVMQDPGTSHAPGEKPFIKVNMYDKDGNGIPCANYEAYSGDGKDGWQTTGGLLNDIVYHDWTTVFVPLDSYMGQDVTFEFIVGDCSQGGHYGYGYLDLECNPFGLLVGTEVPCGPTTLCAPDGADKYQWSTGETTQCITPATTNDYSVTVTPYTGVACSIILDTNVVVVPKSVTADFTTADICVGDSAHFTDGSTATGTTIDTWEWDFDNNGTVDATDQNPSHVYTNIGTYTVELTVTSPDGCTHSITKTINVTECGVDVDVTGDEICEGDCGSIEASPVSGTGPFTYTWSDASLTGTGPHQVCPTVTTDYTVTISDNFGNTDEATATVVVNPLPVLTTSMTGTACGACDGSISVNATGATSYTFSWSNGCTSATCSGVCAGTYSVTVTSDKGCEQTASVNVSNTDGQQIVMDSTDVLCNGTCTGTATSTIISGGTAPFDFSWSNGQTGNSATGHTITGLCAGTYSVTVTDASGCEALGVTVVNEPPALVISHTSVNNPCFGDALGSVDLTVSGGMPGYTYDWDQDGTGDNDDAEDLSNLPAGTYAVTVTDANGCQITDEIIITEPTQLVAGTTATDVSCAGGTDGAVDLNVSGGTPTYTFKWNNNSTGEDLTGVPAGVYTVTVTDNNNCTVIITDTVEEPTPLVLSTTGVDNLCYGDAGGSIDLTASGATPGYTYKWSNGKTTQDLSGLVAGVYAVTVTDKNGCTATAQQNITEPTALVLSGSTTNESCFASNGSATISASGATPGYHYLWDNGATSATNTGLPEGTYCVTVTDNNGCTHDTCLSLVNIPGPISGLSGEDVCEGAATNFADMSTGNVAACAWDFGDGATSTTCGDQSHTYQAPGTYDVIQCVTDAGGCGHCDTIQVTVHPQPVVCFTDSAVGCVPITHQFFNCSQQTGTCLWDFGDGTTSTDCDPTHVFTDPGCYDVTLTITSAEGCTATLMKPCYVEGYPWPTADFLANPAEVSVMNPVVNLFDKSSDAISWEWDFGDSSAVSGAQNPIHTYTDTGCYTIRLAIVNQYGCKDTIEGDICVKDIATIYVPNVFSPNGDGKNEVFRPVHYGYCEMEMYIFDRWGNLIYTTNSLTGGWNGSVENSTEPAQEDVYVWLIKAIDCQGNPWKRIGHVTLIR